MPGKRKQPRAVNRRHDGARDPQRIFNEGVRHYWAERIEAAEAHYRAAVAIKPDYADAHNGLGVLLAAQGHYDEALLHYRRAVGFSPDHVDAHNNLGNLYKYQGRFDDAMAQYEQALAINPADADAHFNRSEIITFRHGDAALAALEALVETGVQTGDLFANKALTAHFALAKALDDTGDYDRAFEHLRKANTLKRQRVAFDEQRSAQSFNRISAVFSSSLFDRFRGEGDPSAVPVFVLGMPRSGSTLIEQILASHAAIQSIGEVRNLDMAVNSIINGPQRSLSYPECVPDLDGAALRRIGQAYIARLPALPDGKIRVVDKTPGNFLGIGLIRLALPNARIIHTVRDPVDTCLSCYSKLFTHGLNFTYDLGELGRYYRRYRELMDHWHAVLPPGAILDVSYEEVVDDLEGQARRMIDYCGLPWDDSCISFGKGSRPVSTASSVQVRKPLFRSSLQRWRRYEAGLGPLLGELKGLVPSAGPV